MRIGVDHASGPREIEVPDAADVIVAEPRPEHPPLADPLAALRDAIEHPYGMEPLAHLVSPSSRVAIAFDDPLKFGPRFLVVPFLVDYLEGLGVSQQQILLVSAGGTHDRPRREDFCGLYRGYIPMFPDDFVDRFWPDRFLVHDAEDASQLVDMGRSALGDVVEHNRTLLDADLTIYSGSVLPLIWGGISGTGVVIGLASPRSIYSHHRLDVIDHPESHHSDPRSSLFQRHKDAVMDRIEEFTGKRVFYVEGVPSPVGGFAGFFAGHFRALREAAWRCADEQHVRPARQYDVIVVGLPKHVFYGETRNPIISLLGAATVARAWRGQPLLRPGGVLIAVTACDGTIDPGLHPSHAEALARVAEAGHARALQDRFDELRTRSDHVRRYREEHAYHGVHPVWLFNEIQYLRDHAGLVVFAEGEPNDPARALGVHCVRGFGEAWRVACAHAGPDPRTLVLPSYFSRVPMIFEVTVD